MTHDRPNFTGTWELDVQKSVILGPQLTRLVVTIEHQEPSLLERLAATYASGSERNSVFEFEIDAPASKQIGETMLQIAASWHEAELVIETRVSAPNRQSYFRDHWSLSRDGQTLTMRHKDDDLHGQVAVLSRR
jgi:hypothetical protein